MKKILVLTADTVGANMAGPAIRAINIAKFLTPFFSVTLCAKTSITKPALPCKLEDISQAEKIIPEMDIIIGHGLFFHKYRFKKRGGQKIIVDLYNLFLTENVITYKDFPEREKSYAYQLDLYKLNFQLLLGDHFLCANIPQLHFIIGMLTALNKVNISNMESVPVTVIPFGIEGREPSPPKNVLKGVYPGIDFTDKVLLWGGGIWDWLDPFTIVKAMKIVSDKRTDVKLFFMGINSPTVGVVVNNEKPLIKLTDDLGLLNTSVFFNSWVPYEERSHYLMEADIGLSLHLRTEETRFSNRTRIMDYLWCELPIISTAGDVMAESVQKHSLGRVVDFQDETELAKIIIGMLENREAYNRYRENIRSYSKHHTWERVLLPLKAICETIEKTNTRTVKKIPFKISDSIKLDLPSLIFTGIRAKGFSDTWKKTIRLLRGKFH